MVYHSYVLVGQGGDKPCFFYRKDALKNKERGSIYII